MRSLDSSKGNNNHNQITGATNMDEDLADSSIGRLLGGMGSFAADMIGSRISPAYRMQLAHNYRVEDRDNERAYQRSQRGRNRKYMKKALGQPASMQTLDDPQSRGFEGPPQTQSIPASGYYRDQDPRQLAASMMSAPLKNTQGYGGQLFNQSILGDRQGPKGKSGKPGYWDVMQMSPEEQQKFYAYSERMKSRSPVVTIDNRKAEYLDPNTSIIDAKGNKVRIPVNTQRGDPILTDKYYGTKKTNEQIKSKAATSSSRRMLRRMGQLMASGVDVTGFEGFVEEARSGSDAMSVFTNALLDYSGKRIKPETAEMLAISQNMGNQILQASRGAAVGPAEKEDFIKQLPMPGQPPAVFQANYEQTMKNLDYISNLTESEISGSVQTDPNWDDTMGPEPGIYWDE